MSEDRNTCLKGLLKEIMKDNYQAFYDVFFSIFRERQARAITKHDSMFKGGEGEPLNPEAFIKFKVKRFAES